MEKFILDVPAGIRYISDWEGFELPETPTIINKQITGCGFTEWCIRNRLNLILASPRKILLENKEEQHPGEVLYIRNDLDNVLDIDKDLNKDDRSGGTEKSYTPEELETLKKHIKKMRSDVQDYYYNTTGSGRPCKILVTYDSFRHVRDALGDKIKDFYVVIDEFQSIFTDSRFKSDTEMEFMNFLQDIKRLCFVSATPMMDEYLEMLPEFNNLPYWDMKWETLDPSRVIKPQLQVKSCKSILPIATGIIQDYLDGRFQKYSFRDQEGIIQEIESRELVIYVNSVKNICDIIKKCGLTYSNTNVLCSNTPENQKKIRKAFNLKRGDLGGIGSVPGKGEPHKMFTLCTRTVYLGADFYSLCARSLILSDANIDCLAVDITLDLPQILGRQRLVENPWKNRAELYYKITKKEESIEDLLSRLKQKEDKTRSLLRSYQNALDIDKHDLAGVYLDRAKSRNYRDDYVAVNTRGGKDLYPVFNNLVMISELRAYQIQQVDYKDRFSVINTINSGEDIIISADKVDIFFSDFDSLSQFTEKMKLLCERSDSFTENELNCILGGIPIIYKNYFMSLGKERIRALQYRKYALEDEYQRCYENQTKIEDLDSLIFSSFIVGNRYTKVSVKQELLNIYTKLGIKLSPKASDLEKYFELKNIQVVNKETGKRDNGYLILSKKK